MLCSFAAHQVAMIKTRWILSYRWVSSCIIIIIFIPLGEKIPRVKSKVKSKTKSWSDHSLEKLLWSKIELRRWIVIYMRWKRKLGSRLSPKIDAILRPRSQKKAIVDLFKGPSVFAAICWNRWPVCTKRLYLAVFWPAACSAAAPPERAVTSVCATVTSQVKGLLRCDGITVKPSGR